MIRWLWKLAPSGPDAPSIPGAFSLMRGAPHSKDSSCYYLQVVAYRKSTELTSSSFRAQN